VTISKEELELPFVENEARRVFGRNARVYVWGRCVVVTLRAGSNISSFELKTTGTEPRWAIKDMYNVLRKLAPQAANHDETLERGHKMATKNQIMGGLNILASYCNGDDLGRDGDNEFMRAEHDQIWAGPDADSVTQEDKEKLEALGWFVSEDAWSRFT
jgi:hypothetical protein